MRMNLSCMEISRAIAASDTPSALAYSLNSASVINHPPIQSILFLSKYSYSTPSPHSLPLRSIGLHLHFPAIGMKHHGPIFIGPKDFNTCLLITPQHRRFWMPEAVVPANAKHGKTRLDRLQEFLRTRCIAPMLSGWMPCCKRQCSFALVRSPVSRKLARPYDTRYTLDASLPAAISADSSGAYKTSIVTPSICRRLPCLATSNLESTGSLSPNLILRA